MSAKNMSARQVEWEILPARVAERAPAELEIETLDAEEEPLPAPGKRTEVVIVIDTEKVSTLVAATGAAAVPIGGVVVAVVYFETIVLVLKWIALSVAGLAGLAAVVFVGGQILMSWHRASMYESRQRPSRQHNTGCGGQGKTANIVQNAQTIINHFH